jgi:hypothetical protein
MIGDCALKFISELCFCNFVCDTVRTDKETVKRLYARRTDLQPEALLNTDSPRDDIGLRMTLGLFGIEKASIDHLLHKAVVAGQSF